MHACGDELGVSALVDLRGGWAAVVLERRVRRVRIVQETECASRATRKTTLG